MRNWVLHNPELKWHSDPPFIPFPHFFGYFNTKFSSNPNKEVIVGNDRDHFPPSFDHRNIDIHV